MVGGKLLIAGLVALALGGFAAQQASEQTISETIGKLREMPDSERAVATKKLALQIRGLEAGHSKVGLAQSLANLSTEGDFGRDTLQEVTTTLAQAVKERKAQEKDADQPDIIAQELEFPYFELAQLARYEHMNVALDDPGFKAALAKLDATDAARAKVDFTLKDLTGKSWTLSSLKGKVVLVNFWATWCPPCRKEMPDLNSLYKELKGKGLVILAISDEKGDTVKKFIQEHGYTYPILLDPDHKVGSAYEVSGIPKSFLYDRQGKMVGQTIDMRTRAQFLALLAKAGIKE